MGELHSMSMAYSSNSLALGGPGLGLALGLGCWDNCHNFNLGMLSSSDNMSSLVMDDFIYAPPFSSTTVESDFSTGYLEDDLVEFSDRSKRRRMLLFNDDSIRGSTTAVANSKAYWNSDWEMTESFDSITHLITSAGLSGDDDEPASMSNTPNSRIYKEDKTSIADTKMNSGEVAIDSSSSLYSCKESANTNSMAADKENTHPISAFPVAGEKGKKKKKREVVTSRVVYPFAVVKPGGVVEGEVTLNDINERISMRPTRPIQHPVGDFACRPCVSEADGPGLSGKAVVALTRIQTQGQGTITIIRTRG